MARPEQSSRARRRPSPPARAPPPSARAAAPAPAAPPAPRAPARRPPRRPSPAARGGPGRDPCHRRADWSGLARSALARRRRREEEPRGRRRRRRTSSLARGEAPLSRDFAGRSREMSTPRARRRRPRRRLPEVTSRRGRSPSGRLRDGLARSLFGSVRPAEAEAGRGQLGVLAHGSARVRPFSLLLAPGHRVVGRRRPSRSCWSCFLSAHTRPAPA